MKIPALKNQLPEERKLLSGYLHNHNKPKSGLKFTAPLDFKAPKRIDWRENGGVTPIQDQGLCASCYAFAAVSISTSDLVAYQVDCNKNVPISRGHS